ncbi:unnamed protein product, partial [Rotaria sp. Silwood2]
MAEGDYIANERYLDVNKEPKMPLTPMQGYELKQLVSLEESVKSLESLIQNIQGFVWSAICICEEAKDGLTPSERAAVCLYTMDCLCKQLNAALRSPRRQQLFPYFSYLKLLLTALWKLPNFNGLVYRGVKVDLSAAYPKGKKIIWWGLSSCSTDLAVLQSQDFLGMSGKRTRFDIECFCGKLIENHSQFSEEHECLLLPCSYFEVIDNTKEGTDLTIVRLRQIQPPVPLIQPPFTTSQQQFAQNTLNVASATQHVENQGTSSTLPSALT